MCICGFQMCVLVCVLMHIWRSEKDVGSLLYHSVSCSFEVGFLTKHGARLWVASKQALFILLCPCHIHALTCMCSYTHTRAPHMAFYVGAGNLNSGFCAYTESTFTL